MSTTIEYKGYVGSIEADLDDGTLFGRIVNVEGGLMYEGATLLELRENMHAVIDDYLALCKERGEQPRLPFSGKLPLRMDPLLHSRLAAAAEAEGTSMNQLVIEAITRRLGA